MKGLTPVDNSQLASCLVRAALYLNEWCLGLVRISRSRLASRIDQHGLLSIGGTTAGMHVGSSEQRSVSFLWPSSARAQGTLEELWNQIWSVYFDEKVHEVHYGCCNKSSKYEEAG